MKTRSFYTVCVHTVIIIRFITIVFEILQLYSNTFPRAAGITWYWILFVTCIGVGPTDFDRVKTMVTARAGVLTRSKSVTNRILSAKIPYEYLNVCCGRLAPRTGSA